MSGKPNCFGQFNPDFWACREKCRFRVNCEKQKNRIYKKPVGKSYSQSANEYYDRMAKDTESFNREQERRENGIPKRRVFNMPAAPKAKPILFYGHVKSENIDLAFHWGIYQYRLTVKTIGHLELADEYDWLEKEKDTTLKNSRMSILKEEVERRCIENKVWKDWEEFLGWVESN